MRVRRAKVTVGRGRGQVQKLVAVDVDMDMETSAKTGAISAATKKLCLPASATAKTQNSLRCRSY